MPSLLIVDDEPNIRYSLEKSLKSDDLFVVTAATGKAGIAAVEKFGPDAVIMDVRLPDMSGLVAIEGIREIDPMLPIVVITAHGTAETAIQAMSAGAIEYLLKPLDLHQLREVVRRAIDISRMRKVPAIFEQEEIEGRGTVDRIIGNSPSMQDVYKAVGRVAPHDAIALILGESGTGKEVIARAIFQHSTRKNGPFLALNCAAIPENLLESELFGHEKGAFTGADRRRIGKFEQVDGGTLFLDEIGDLAPATQAKLLRLLQEQQFERLGGNETIKTDVRIIAATNQDLTRRVAEGAFRSDLYFRLNGYTIHLPPLRDRKSDIPSLASYFMARSGKEMKKPDVQVMPAAMDLLLAYHWPGNVRELQSCLRFALLHAPANLILPEYLPESIRRASGTTTTLSTPDTAPMKLDLEAELAAMLMRGEKGIYDQICEIVDRTVVSAVLKHAKGNQGVASEILGISRTTLRQKLKHLNLAVELRISDSNPSD